MKKTAFIFLLSGSLGTSSSLLAAENAIYMIGGGGEPTGAKTTQFDDSVKALGQFVTLNKRKYEATINFNGGHETTEEIIKKEWPGAKVREGFTKSNYEQIIQDMKDKLLNNPPEIPENGKMLLFINSHGGEKEGKTHSISLSESPMTNMNSGSDDMVSLDSLQELIDLADAKKVKLAIIDGSCHSGNTMNLKRGEKTCVITGSGPNHYAYSSFADVFANQMFYGRNLEEFFEMTRTQTSGAGFPMISTPEGLEAQDKLYPLLTPYMYYHDEYRGMQLDKIDNYLLGIKNDELMCQKDVQHNQLQKLLDLIEDMNSITRKSWWSSKVTIEKTVDLNELKLQIVAYKKTQEEYIEKLRKLDMSEAHKIEKVTGKFQENRFTRKEIITTNYDELIAGKAKELTNMLLTAAQVESANQLLDFYEEAKKVQQKLLAENPDYAQYRTTMESLKTDVRTSRETASSIAKLSHEAYTAYYQARRKENLAQDKKATNPCKDFVL